jgi:hypothetical protein
MTFMPKTLFSNQSNKRVGQHEKADLTNRAFKQKIALLKHILSLSSKRSLIYWSLWQTTPNDLW